MATHPSVLDWRIPGTGEPSGLPSMGSHRVEHDWSDLALAWIESIPLFALLNEYALSAPFFFFPYYWVPYKNYWFSSEARNKFSVWIWITLKKDELYLNLIFFLSFTEETES